MNEFRPIISFHPGTTLKHKMDEMGITLEELSNKMGVSKKDLKTFINGKSKVTNELAKLLESATGISFNFWKRKQFNYDQYIYEINLKKQERESEKENE